MKSVLKNLQNPTERHWLVRSSAFFDGGRDGKTPAAKIAWLELALKHQDSNCVYCYLDRSVQFSVFFNLHLI